MGHMNPNLMRAPGFKPTLYQSRHRRRPKRLDDPRPRHRVPPTMKQNRLFLSVCLMPGKLRGDAHDITTLKAHALHAAQTRVIGIWHAIDHRLVIAFDRVLLELRRKPLMGAVGFRHHEKPRGFLVNPMHDPRSLHPANTRKALAAMMQKRIDQGAIWRPRRGVNNHPRRFIDDDKVRILVNHLKRNILRADMALVRHGNGNLHKVALGHLGLGIFCHNPVEPHRPLAKQPRQPRTRKRCFFWHIT